MRASLCAVIACASMAGAEVPPAAGPAATFDIIFNVPDVQSVAFDPATGALYAAVSPIGNNGGASAIVRWQLDPVRIDGIWPTGTVVSDLAVSPAGLVYAAGQRGASPGQAPTKATSAGSGSVINLDPGHAASPVFEAIRYTDDGINAVSRFNQVAFGNNGAVYVASPTQFSVTVLSDSQDPVVQNVTLPQLVLTCGAPAQLSLFPAGGRTGYAASTTDGALLETGVVDAAPDAYGKAPSNCFRIANVFGYDEAPSTLNSVVHAVLADPSGQPDAILVLEPNTGTLHLLRLDVQTQQLARIDRTELADKGDAVVAGAFNLLAANADGSVIFVGGKDRDSILRFQRDGDHLRPVGTLFVGSGLRSVRIGIDGVRAALVIRDGAGLDRIHVIRDPGGLGGGWQRLPSGGATLRRVQSELIERGFGSGPADGMLGPRTLSAIDQMLESENSGESWKKEIQSNIDGVLFTRQIR